MSKFYNPPPHPPVHIQHMTNVTQSIEFVFHIVKTLGKGEKDGCRSGRAAFSRERNSLTLSQTTNFRPFETERVCRQHIRI